MRLAPRYVSVFTIALACLLNLATQSLSGLPVAATDDESIWQTDVAAAFTQARNEQKDLFLLFTGSDWCPPCIKLEEQILGKPEFATGVDKDFVLVKLDFPQDSELPPELEKQNQQWSDRYGIEGFPTVVLVDTDEQPYAFTGFRDEGPSQYIAHLAELRQTREKRDEALEKAADAVGIERAQFLDEALSAMDPIIVEVYYTDLVEEIGQLDADDEAGLRTKYFARRDREMRQAIMSNIAMVSRLRKPADAIEFIDATLAESKLPLDMWLIAQQTKLRLLRRLERVDEANTLIDQMMNAPDLHTDSRQRLVNNKAFYLASLNRHQDAFTELDRQIQTQPENLLMTIAVGDLHDSLGQQEQAVAAYDKAMAGAAARPEIFLEVVEARADALFELQRSEEALATLDRLIDDAAIPGTYRAQALLHKALLLRENGRRRAAILAENRSVELVESIEEKAEIQKLVDQFRRKFETAPQNTDPGDSGDDSGDDSN